MKSIVTKAGLICLCLAWALPVQAQTARNGQDVVWARDLGDAEITFDGALDEAVWQEADSLIIRRENNYVPGGGWQDFDAAIEEPTDPVDATVYFLRDGNLLWIGVDARDKSIGGTRDFFQMDGLVMSIINRTNREGASERNRFGNGSNSDEFFYSWMNRQEITDTVGMDPLFFGNLEENGEPVDDTWDGRTVVDGISNDDFNGNAEQTDDVGYTMEVWIDLEKLGYDMTDADGDRLPMTVGIYDLDYQWPTDADRAFRTRAWWQNPWGGDMPMGVGYVYGAPDVTVTSGDAPEITEPDVRVPNTPDDITLDGVLDEDVWGLIEPQVVLQYQMSDEMFDALPGVGPYYTHWWNTQDPSPTVVDPSIGQIRMFHQDNMLYIGLDSDDQAVNGQAADATDEASADGLRIIMRQPEATTAGMPPPAWQFWVLMGEDGEAIVAQDANRPDTVMAAGSLKGATTVSDPSDIDEGYQLEIAIDLEALGFDLEEGRVIYIGANYFDGDVLDPSENSYGTRTWWLAERGSGPLAGAYLDPDLVVTDVEAPTAELPETIVLEGNYPNPFNPATTLRYLLPQAGQVTVGVYDVLGRRVATLAPGLQPAGPNELSFDGTALTSGVYFYRISVAGLDAAGAIGRMMLLK